MFSFRKIFRSGCYLSAQSKDAYYCKRISDTYAGRTFYYSFHPQISPFGTIDTRFRTFIAPHKSIYLVFSTGPTGPKRNSNKKLSPGISRYTWNVVTSRGPITLGSPTYLYNFKDVAHPFHFLFYLPLQILIFTISWRDTVELSIYVYMYGWEC